MEKARENIGGSLNSLGNSIQVFRALHHSQTRIVLLVVWIEIYFLSNLIGFSVGIFWGFLFYYSLFLIVAGVWFYLQKHRKLRSDRNLTLFSLPLILAIAIPSWILIFIFWDFLTPVFGLLGITFAVKYVVNKFDKILSKYHLFLMIAFGVLLRFVLSGIFNLGLIILPDGIAIFTEAQYDGMLVTIYLITIASSSVVYLVTLFSKSDNVSRLKTHLPVIMVGAYIFNNIVAFSFLRDLSIDSGNQVNFNVADIIIVILGVVFLMKSIIEQVLINIEGYSGLNRKIREFLRANTYSNILILMSSVLMGVYVSNSSIITYVENTVNLFYATIFFPIAFIIFLLNYNSELNSEVMEVSDSLPQQQFCINCGAKRIPGKSFCNTCGQKFQDKKN